MPKFMVEIIASYPCVVDAQTIEEAFEIAENCPWDDWPDDDCEIVEYCAELIVEDSDEQPPPVTPIKSKMAGRPKLTLVRDS
jgi:hypothetical protein